MNSVILQAFSNGIYLWNQQQKLSLILQNVVCVETILEIGSMNLFSMEPSFGYPEMLKF